MAGLGCNVAGGESELGRAQQDGHCLSRSSRCLTIETTGIELPKKEYTWKRQKHAIEGAVSARNCNVLQSQLAFERSYSPTF